MYKDGAVIFAQQEGKGLIDFDRALDEAVVCYFSIIVWYIALCAKRNVGNMLGEEKRVEQHFPLLLNASLKEKELKGIHCRLKFGICL